FAADINHIVYHGTAYSPPDAPWPGWLFYASTEFNPRNPFWDDFAALNAYVARVQSVLQSSQPDNDVLLYWPFADAIDDSQGLMKQFAVHNVSWLVDSPMGKAAKLLTARGYGFDYISDAQLMLAKVQDGALVVPGGNYRTVIIPATRRMPVETLEQLLKLKRAGAAVIFEALPEDVPGYGRLVERRTALKALLAAPELANAAESDLAAALEKRNVRREPVAETGLSFTRRRSIIGHDYFFANLTAKPFDGWVTLGVEIQNARLIDPLTGGVGAPALRGGREFYLQLAAGESAILRTENMSLPLGRWTYTKPVSPGVPLAGEWTITFLKGGPELPPALKITELKSWTELGGDEAKRFAGTARYRLEFDLPAQKADDWLLDLGDVRESARVRVNGVDVITAWSIPFRVHVGAQLKPGRNVLDLDVTNLAANRIRDMDQRGVQWKIMREINFVNINYKPFDASQWNLTPSGLLGPIVLVPLHRFDPSAP
ncbi:MAG TPA: glycosyl hydrolase, partial [Candidatus Didemnitutus sp.]|nr:glycosyl hydrolase [Candidatus Didemnitutus sp.]